MTVTSVRWGGEGLIYSGSQDRTIKVWDTEVMSHSQIVKHLQRGNYVEHWKVTHTGSIHWHLTLTTC
jgi:WD40 repeat protein